MYCWYSNFDRINQRCVQFVDMIWWHNSLSLFCYYNFYSEKGFRFWPKKSFCALVGTIGLHSNSGTSFMSMVIKGMIRITNEDRQLLSSLAIIIIPLTARLIKEIPGLVYKPIVPTIGKDFWGPKSETFFWKEIVITEEWKRVMPPNYVHKIVHISDLFCQSSSIISASGRKLLKMKNSKSFF